MGRIKTFEQRVGSPVERVLGREAMFINGLGERNLRERPLPRVDTGQRTSILTSPAQFNFRAPLNVGRFRPSIARPSIGGDSVEKSSRGLFEDLAARARAFGRMARRAFVMSSVLVTGGFVILNESPGGKGTGNAQADEKIALAEDLLKKGDMAGSLQAHDEAIVLLTTVGGNALEEAKHRRDFISKKSSELEKFRQEASDAENNDDFASMRTALYGSLNIYRNMGYLDGQLDLLKKISWTYEQQKDWGYVHDAQNEIVNLAEMVDEKVPRAKILVEAWRKIKSALAQLEEARSAEDAQNKIDEYEKIIADAGKAPQTGAPTAVVEKRVVPSNELGVRVEKLMAEGNQLIKNGEGENAAGKYLEAAELLVRSGDLDGAVNRLDDALLGVAFENDSAFAKIKIRREVLFATNSILATLDENIKNFKQAEMFAGMREVLDAKFQIYQDIKCVVGMLRTLEITSWTYERHNDWNGVVDTQLRILEVANFLDGSKLERAPHYISAYERMTSAYNMLGNAKMAEEVQKYADEYRDSMADAEEAAKSVKPAPAAATETLPPPPPAQFAREAEKRFGPIPPAIPPRKIPGGFFSSIHEAENFIGAVGNNIKRALDRAENMVKSGGADQLKAASRLYEMVAKCMELFDDVNVAQEMYVKAAGALLAKPFMTSFDLERAAELYEASSIDPDNADIRYQAAARYRMDAAQRWLYVGETVKAIRNADLALQDIEFIRVPTAREDKAKAVELKERAMAMLTAEAPMIRDHYAVRVPADTVLAYLKQQNSTSAGAFEITLVQTAVYYALKNHEAEMRPLLKDGALTVEACQKARELWKKGSK